MLETLKLQELARRIFAKRLPSIQLDEVQAAQFTGSDGEPALRIKLVLTPESADAISGEDALKLLAAIRDELVQIGDERLPILEYATADDLPTEEDQAS
ncbi:MAG: hypothetical protein C0515_04460 [Novosphingobium sp.]|nr:hypothetical protein [Novosphingobium sp.]MBX9642637.1 hypothetical protein [Novosphingobium sp.]